MTILAVAIPAMLTARSAIADQSATVTGTVVSSQIDRSDVVSISLDVTAIAYGEMNSSSETLSPEIRVTNSGTVVTDIGVMATDAAQVGGSGTWTLSDTNDGVDRYSWRVWSAAGTVPLSSSVWRDFPGDLRLEPGNASPAFRLILQTPTSITSGGQHTMSALFIAREWSPGE